MPNVENQPFEASYEGAKQSIINYMGEISRLYDIPIPLLNILIYEIALESRNASFSAIVGNCDIAYPEQPEIPEQPISEIPKPTVAKKEFERKGMTIEKAPADKSA